MSLTHKLSFKSTLLTIALLISASAAAQPLREILDNNHESRRLGAHVPARLPDVIHARSNAITPEMIGSVVSVYNVKGMESSLAEKEEFIKERARQVQNREFNLIDMETKLSAAKMHLESKLTKVVKRKKEQTSKQDKLDRLQGEVDAKTTELDAFAQELADHQKELKTLQTKHDDEKDKKELQKLKDVISIKEDVILKTNSRVKHTKETLKKEKEHLQKQQNEFKDIMIENEVGAKMLEMDLKNYEYLKSNLKKALNLFPEQQQKFQEAKQMFDKEHQRNIKLLEDKEEQLRERIIETQLEKNMTEIDINTQMFQIDEDKKQIGLSQSALSKMKRELEMTGGILERKKATLKAKESSLEEELKDKQIKLTVNQHELDEMRRKSQSIKDQEQLKNLRFEMEAKVGKVDAQQKDLDGLKDRLYDEKKKIKKVQKELKEKVKQTDAIGSRISADLKKYESLKADLETRIGSLLGEKKVFESEKNQFAQQKSILLEEDFRVQMRRKQIIDEEDVREDQWKQKENKLSEKEKAIKEERKKIDTARDELRNHRRTLTQGLEKQRQEVLL